MKIEIKDSLVEEFQKLNVEKGDGESLKVEEYINGLMFNDLQMVREIFKKGEKQYQPGDADDGNY